MGSQSVWYPRWLMLKPLTVRARAAFRGLSSLLNLPSPVWWQELAAPIISLCYDNGTGLAALQRRLFICFIRRRAWGTSWQGPSLPFFSISHYISPWQGWFFLARKLILNHLSCCWQPHATLPFKGLCPLPLCKALLPLTNFLHTHTHTHTQSSSPHWGFYLSPIPFIDALL